MAEECIFCKIVKGEIPSVKIFETPDFLSFLDIHPICEGHAIVIPRNHYANLYETPVDVAADLMKVVQEIVVTLKKTLGAKGVNIIQNNEPAAGQVVNHIHFHVIPRYGDDNLVIPSPREQADADALNSVADKIRSLSTS